MPGVESHLFFQDELLQVRPLDARVPILTVPYQAIRELEIGGPGATRTGGGFVGGGFGLAGFAIGAAAAGIVNKLTTRTRVVTLIGISTGTGELIFATGSTSPEALRLTLSKPLRQISDMTRRLIATSSTIDSVAQLRDLTDLHTAGGLTDSEFEQAKAAILRQMNR